MSNEADAEAGDRQHDFVTQFWVRVGALLFALLVATIAWQNVHLISRWTSLFVDRELAVQACIEASTRSRGLPDRPSFPILGGASIGSLEWHLQQNERNAAISAAAAEVRQRDITMIVAAEGSRDLQLAQAAAQSASRLVSVCRSKGYPVG